jgi:2-dehydropantoate 2-reductase
MNLQALKKGETKGKGYAHIASMLKDIWNHSPTEIDWITGSFIREAGKVGIPVPLNKTLYSLVKAREASWEYDYLREAN